jgi:predicted AAA+ superfamily ATPase
LDPAIIGDRHYDTARAVQMRKLIVVDTGLAAHLSGRTSANLARDAARAGALLENFVLGELARQLTWSTLFAALHHYRTRDGDEVDAVIEAPDGRIVGIEVKAAATVDGADFRHLKHLADRVPDQFQHGFVLYTGRRVLQFGDRMTAAPIAALWA